LSRQIIILFQGVHLCITSFTIKVEVPELGMPHCPFWIKRSRI